MDNPASEIEQVILNLTTGSPQVQEEALRTYFVSDAAFIHPFCYVPRFSKGTIPIARSLDSQWVLLCIYRWYRILSPEISISIDSVAFDGSKGLLYVSIRQTFRLWFIPFYSAPVRLVTVLQVERRASSEITTKGTDKYYILSQEDLYQMNDCIQFGLPRLGTVLWTGWQLFSTLVCIIMSLVFLPLYYLLNKGQQQQKLD